MIASHWEAVGFAASDEEAFDQMLHGALVAGAEAGRWEHGFTVVAEDSSGARITIHVGQDGSVRCVQPGFAGASTFTWRPEHVVPDGGCPLCDVVMADLVDDDGELFYPLALTVETIGHMRSLIPFGERGEVAFAALCESGEVWSDEAAFESGRRPPGPASEDGADASFPGFAARSLVPIGTFRFEPTHDVTSHVLAHGVVESVDLRRNELGGGEFTAVRLDTLGGVFDVCVAPGSLEREDLLAPGAVLGGTFWLVGRPVTLRPEPGPVPTLQAEAPTRPGRLSRIFGRRGA